MKTIKTSEASGPALDWIAAKAQGLTLYKDATLGAVYKTGWWVSGLYKNPNKWVELGSYSPSTSPHQAHLLIEEEKINVIHSGDAFETPVWLAYYGPIGPARMQTGPTHLIAAIRCYVDLKLGTEVEVPEELL